MAGQPSRRSESPRSGGTEKRLLQTTTGYTVVENGQLIGIITDRDIVIRAVAEGRDLLLEQVRDHLTPNPTTISPDADVQEASELMAREQIRRLPVVENGRLVGFLAIGDLAVELNKDQVVGDALQKISEPAQPRSSEGGA